MSKSILMNGAIICIPDTDFKCPECGHQYHADDYEERLYKAKKTWITKKCKSCGIKMSITTDFKGDVVVWL
jgi:transcription elongation factor Elf1